MANITIKVFSEALSDKSKVFNVVLRDGQSVVRFAACGEGDAHRLVAAIERAINSYTVDSAEAVY